MFDIVGVIEYFRKHFSKKDVIVIIFLVVLFCASRSINLENLPVFNDEGIYIHWAKVAWHDASWRFVSLTDGKQPLQTWGTIPLLKLLPDNALVAGRLFSGATGLFALCGIFVLLFYVFNKKTAYIGSLLYIFTPYFLFYDRMAMVDSGVNAFFIWILFFSILLVRQPRLDVALLFGLIGGFGSLAKSSVRVFVGLSALAPILYIRYKNRVRHVINFFVLFSIVIFFVLLIYNVQRLSPFLHFVEEKNKTFVMTFGEWRQNPFAVLFSNLRTIPYYVISELGFIILPFGLLGIIRLIRKDRWLGAYMLTWIILPYLAISLMTRVLFPRYIIFFGTLIVIFASYFFGSLKDTKKIFTLLSLVLATNLVFNYFIVFDYRGIIFPDTDRGQYIEGATVGVGIREIIEYAREQSLATPVIILAEGNFGMAGDVLDVFLRRDDRIFIKGYWPLSEKELIENQSLLKDNKVYVVYTHLDKIPENHPVRLIKSFYKPNNKSVIFFAELIK